MNTLLILGASLFLIVRGATLSTTYAIRLSRSLELPRYTVGFLVVSAISILPELLIAIISSLTNVPEFALGVLFGSNIADLTLIFALIILLTGRALSVQKSTLKDNELYIFLLLMPVLLGLDGYFSRTDGILLIAAGVFFYYQSLKNRRASHAGSGTQTHNYYRTFFLLLLAIGMLLTGAYLAVSSASALATTLGVSPVLIGMFIVGLGTTLPELFFSLKSHQRHNDALAEGDLLGTVLVDATIVVGTLAAVSPFAFPKSIMYITGAFMVAAAFFLFYLMRSDRTLTKREGFFLFLFWVAFLATELLFGA